MEHKTVGQIAFELYNEAKGGLTYDNKPIPPWDKVSVEVKQAWEAAASGVIAWWDNFGREQHENKLALDDLK